ncbi:MAG: prepilin-type N-terminal cleavage/methylation domain-containing protein [Mariniblastus sp.]|nr:prepilin-type N-terminal cleavage/methylation domain-containing protein [Mariniblastus sp.]
MKSYLYHNRPHDIRRGFTVVEVLVAITIIAILAAILTPVVGSALRRANEFAIESEMSQLDLAIEHFKSDNGFYPPSFASFDSADDILPYLNRLAPNHAEGNGGVGTRLKNWWDQVGSDLAKKDASGDLVNPGASLVFWLSGIAKNKQYPLTLPADGLVALSGYNRLDENVERNAYFEFSADRLDTPPNADTVKIQHYLQARGPAEPYLYLDSGSYGTAGGYCENGNPPQPFFNPTSFQLVAAGLDGQIGNTANGGLIASQCGPRGMDNIINFVGEGVGKLETKALGID